jgi:hypothetical protein
VSSVSRTLALFNIFHATSSGLDPPLIWLRITRGRLATPSSHGVGIRSRLVPHDKRLYNTTKRSPLVLFLSSSNQVRDPLLRRYCSVPIDRSLGIDEVASTHPPQPDIQTSAIQCLILDPQYPPTSALPNSCVDLASVNCPPSGHRPFDCDCSWVRISDAIRCGDYTATCVDYANYAMSFDMSLHSTKYLILNEDLSG